MAEHLSLHNAYNKIVYTCGAFKATHYEHLVSEKIDAMLYLNHETKDKNTLDLYTYNGIQHYYVEMPEEPKNCNFSSVFKKCIKIIEHFDNNNGKIVVYCSSGETYAPAIATAYILYKFYVVEKQKSKNSKSLVVHILETLQQNNRDISLDQMSVEIVALAEYERAKIKERNMLDKIRNTDVESVDLDGGFDGGEFAESDGSD